MRAAAWLLFVICVGVASAQERLLVPVAYQGGGAFGSSWSTVVGGLNRAQVPWRSPEVGFLVSCVPVPEPCFVDELPPMRAGMIVTNEFEDGLNAPTGLILYLPEGQNGGASVWARFGEESTASGPLADEMPTPRESDFTTDTIFLPLVTVGAAPVRTTLRIYDIDGVREVRVRVRARTAFGGPGQEQTVSTTVRPQQPVGSVPIVRPGYAELSLTSAFGQRFGVADIEIIQEDTPPNARARLWAFITITSNATNEVGIVTPR